MAGRGVSRTAIQCPLASDAPTFICVKAALHASKMQARDEPLTKLRVRPEFHHS